MTETTFYTNHFIKQKISFLFIKMMNGLEHDLVANYIQSSLSLATWYRKDSDFANPLLEELFLRRLFYNLLNTINDATKCPVLRRICLNQIHEPLIALKHYYNQSRTGHKHFLLLQKDLK
ncbi:MULTISPECIES: hypothetical protein [unclassified Photobacterium]|uniref:hypothetical protein n=1 Tax=unclassified Photobacterium TaxID=2628852 RepID=UPI001EDE0247|nr:MULTISPECIES: hypothetical protein [unclassified Photobacterium]